jgi:hypothetical protein
VTVQLSFVLLTGRLRVVDRPGRVDHQGASGHTHLVPTTRPRHLVTETDDLASALDAAAQRWLGLSCPQPWYAWPWKASEPRSTRMTSAGDAD